MPKGGVQVPLRGSEFTFSFPMVVQMRPQFFTMKSVTMCAILMVDHRVMEMGGNGIAVGGAG